MEPLLNITHVSKYYGENANVTKALDDVCFTVEPGEFVGIMGASGSGKTTMLQCISTLDEPTGGQILLDKKDITKLTEREIAHFRSKNLGFVFQEYNLLDNMTLQDNIALPLSLNGKKSREILEKVDKMADMFGLSAHLNKYPYQLSGGQKQRGASARALITEPRILFANEPTGALDSRSSRDLLLSLKAANEKGKATILMVTHDAYTASYAKQVYFLSDGQIQCRLNNKEDRKLFYDEILKLLASMGGERE